MAREQMTVADLVKALQQCDPEALVYVGDPDKGLAYELLSVDSDFEHPEEQPDFVVLTHDRGGEIPI